MTTKKERREKFASSVKTVLEDNMHGSDERNEFKESMKGQWKGNTPDNYFGLVRGQVLKQLLHTIEIERNQLLRAEEFIRDEVNAWELDEENPGAAHDDGIEIVNHIEKHLHATLERKRHINNQCAHARHTINDHITEAWGKKTARTLTGAAGAMIAAPVTVPMAVGKGVARGIGKAVGIGKKE